MIEFVLFQDKQIKEDYLKPKGGFYFIKKSRNADKSITTTNDIQGKGSSLLQILGNHPESVNHNNEVKNNVNVKQKKIEKYTKCI